MGYDACYLELQCFYNKHWVLELTSFSTGLVEQSLAHTFPKGRQHTYYFVSSVCWNGSQPIWYCKKSHSDGVSTAGGKVSFLYQPGEGAKGEYI